MIINVRYRAHLAELTKTGAETMETAGNKIAMVKDVLRHIKKSFGPEAEKNAKSMIITVNGHSILHLDHYKTQLREGDEVSFMPICGGG